jgi:hypothetical protein
MLVALTGLKGVGKDEAVNHLVSLGFTKLAFGDAIYKELAINFKVPEEFLRMREVKETPHPRLALAYCQDHEFVRYIVASAMTLPAGCDHGIRALSRDELTKPRTSTWLTQQWATQYRRRHFSDDYWTRIVVDQIRALPRGTNVVLSDLRHFPVEMAAFDAYRDTHTHRAGSLTIAPAMGILELTRDGSINTGHDSDRGLPRDLIDKTYVNNGTLTQLYAALELFITLEIK